MGEVAVAALAMRRPEGAENEKPASREKRGLFLDSPGPYGEGHTMGPGPKLIDLLGAEFADQGAGIGIDLDK
jgi:hypothetical protein